MKVYLKSGSVIDVPDEVGAGIIKTYKETPMRHRRKVGFCLAHGCDFLIVLSEIEAVY
jgi:hypothetical protein